MFALGHKAAATLTAQNMLQTAEGTKSLRLHLATFAEGTIPATRTELDSWMKTLPKPWTVAMEASIFTGWVYDHLLPHAAH